MHPFRRIYHLSSNDVMITTANSNKCIASSNPSANELLHLLKQGHCPLPLFTFFTSTDDGAVDNPNLTGFKNGVQVWMKGVTSH